MTAAEISLHSRSFSSFLPTFLSLFLSFFLFLRAGAEAVAPVLRADAESEASLSVKKNQTKWRRRSRRFL